MLLALSARPSIASGLLWPASAVCVVLRSLWNCCGLRRCRWDTGWNLCQFLFSRVWGITHLAAMDLPIFGFLLVCLFTFRRFAASASRMRLCGDKVRRAAVSHAFLTAAIVIALCVAVYSGCAAHLGSSLRRWFDASPFGICTLAFFFSAARIGVTALVRLFPGLIPIIQCCSPRPLRISGLISATTAAPFRGHRSRVSPSPQWDCCFHRCPCFAGAP